MEKCIIVFVFIGICVIWNAPTVVADRNVSQAGYNLIKGFEGLYLVAYPYK